MLNKALLTLAFIGILTLGVGELALVKEQKRISEVHSAITDMQTRIDSNLGATDSNQFVGGQVYYISGGGISGTGASIGLTSFTIPQTGQKLAMTDFGTTIYGTIEPGNRTRQEFVSCTGLTQNSDGSATLTTCSRGISPIYPYTASTTLGFSHGGGATFIVSNSPAFYNNLVSKANSSTITGQFTFASTSLPQVATNTTDAQLVTNGTNTLATLNYVNNVSIAGANNFTESVKGIGEGATALEQASSTILGSTGAGLFSQARYATDTPQSSCAVGYTAKGASCVPVANLLGVLNPFWIATSSAYTYNWGAATMWTASSTHTATTSFAASSLTNNALGLNGLFYQFPSVRGASSTALLEDGTGKLTFGYPPSRCYSVATSSTFTGTNSWQFTMSYNLGGTPSVVRANWSFGDGDGTQVTSTGSGIATTTGSTGGSYQAVVTNLAGSNAKFSNVSNFISMLQNGDAVNTTGYVSSWSPTSTVIQINTSGGSGGGFIYSVVLEACL